MKLHHFFGGILCGLLAFSAVFAQNSNDPQAAGIGLPYFSLRVFSTFQPDSGDRIARVIVQITNENLTFLKSDSGYEAEVQIEIFMNDPDKDFAFSRTISQKVIADDYNTTVSSENNTFNTDVQIAAGKYLTMVTVTDKNNNNQYTRKAKFEINPASATQKQIQLSDIMFFSNYETDDNGDIVNFHPSMNNTFSSDKAYIYAYYDTYTSDPKTPVEIQYLVKDENGVVVQDNQYHTRGNEKFKKHFVRLNRYYFNRNRYSLELIAHVGEQWIVKNTTFAFFWRFAPTTHQDLDLAIRQLRYIAKEDSIKKYLKASFKNKRRFFKQFWSERDPDPTTEENELMKEYYRRVNFVNANFSTSGVGGWLTDRGRIFIKFGEPDEIERHPFEAETYPYQIWRYYSVQKVFLFIDRTGFGDYDLHPSYYYVEYD